MSKVVFAQTVIAKILSMTGDDGTVYTPATRELLGTAIGLGTAEYLLAHMKLNVAYAGTTPSGMPDVCTDIVPVVGTCGPVLGNTFEEWVLSLQDSIMSGIKVGVASIIPAGVIPAVTIPGLLTFLAQAKLYAVHKGNYDDPQKPLWEEVGQSVIDWIIVSKIPTYPASHGGSVGTATVTSVSFI